MISADSIKKKRRPLLCLCAVMLGFLAAMVWFGISWMLKTWANLTMDELVYHLTSTIEGVNADLIISFLLECALPSAATAAAVMLLHMKWGRKHAAVLPAAALVLLIAAIGVRLYQMDREMGVWQYFENQKKNSTFIENNYVDPAETKLTFPEKKRNLIYIFLESMEITYTDRINGGAFETGVIPELTELAQRHEDFSGSYDQLNGAYVMPACSWTMAAMFAQTSGLPLKITIEDNAMDTQESFFPGVTTLGDVLNEAGYRQMLLIGSDAVFGGRELYFSNHGQYIIRDHPYAQAEGLIPEDYEVFWGYEDEKLFDYAKHELLQLASQDEPFNLTMLTVDTHFEDGYVCAKCPDEYEGQYANVMACSSKQVAEFVSWIQQQDFYENTTVVLAGDHLTMDSNFCAYVSENYDRKTYTAYINAACDTQDPDQKRLYSTFDAFPTTLAALGVDIAGDRLGLGTNLFSSQQTLLERYGEIKTGVELGKSSLFMYEQAAIFPVELKDYDIRKNTVSLYVGELERIDEVFVGVELTQNGKTESICRKNRKREQDSEMVVELPRSPSADQELTVYVMYSQGERMNLKTITGYPLAAIDDIGDYLEALSSLREDYVVLIAVKDDASAALTPEITDRLQALGLKEDLTGQYRSSYCAVLTPDDQFEKIGNEALETEQVLGDGTELKLISAGFESGNTASVCINGAEYACNSRGLNIVVYDPVRGEVIDSVAFDTCKGKETVR